MSHLRSEETDIKKETKEALEACGYLVRRVHSGKVKSRHGGWMVLAEAGTADLVVQGLCFTAWLELKTEKGSFSDEQELFAGEITRRGGNYLTARSCAEAVEKVRAIGAAS